MTGRELIIYILENNLEDVSIIENGKFVGFMTVEEAAEKFDVGTSTVRAWITRGLLKSVTIYDNVYIPINAADPKLILSGGKV